MDVSSHLWSPWGCWHDLRRLYFWYPGNFCVDEAFLWDLVTWNLIFWVSPVRSTQAIPCQLLPIMFNFGWADWLFEFRPQLTGLVLKRPWTVLLAFLASSTSATTFLTNAAKRTLNGSWGMAVLSLLLLGLRLGVQRTSNRSQEYRISAIQILTPRNCNTFSIWLKIWMPNTSFKVCNSAKPGTCAAREMTLFWVEDWWLMEIVFFLFVWYHNIYCNKFVWKTSFSFTYEFDGFMVLTYHGILQSWPVSDNNNMWRA